MTRPQAVEEEMKCAIGKDCGHPYHTFPMLANRVQVLAAEITRLEGENAALAKTIESYKHTVAGWRAHAALEVEAAALRKRVEAILTAVLRYESRHDRDPERVKLWAEVKAAFVELPEAKI